MLTSQLLKNHAGILLCGDYTTLRSLHEVVHTVNEKSPLIRDKDGLFLGLAYDIRKAYERQRQVINPPVHFPEIGIRYGVEMLWPVVLVQSRMLRASLAYFDSNKQQQALTYGLESVLEEAITQEFKSQAEVIIHRWNRIDPAHPWAEEKLNSRGALFCSWSKADRRKKLPGLLASLDPMYPFFYRQAVANGDSDLVSPEDLDTWDDEEWEDPRW
ncbi:DUF6904 family protein [Aeromonas veronii]|jgi:hypothetical protein|uniref:DUF6904 family protein n=1 Tax=Aeromonas TaxID=642 RepID=UPI002649A022|nr:hypothetical protein [Aeromonas caviae]MDN6867371.1 hypothetical protein [Aeromonas caviae]